jgi:hypothetical protein
MTASVRYAALICLLAASASAAQSTGSSILVFPDVAGTPARDTIIRMANTSPRAMVYVECWYGPGVESQKPGTFKTKKFDVWLTQRQPTHWLVSRGRQVDPTDDVTGYDPGAVPAFTLEGSLVCIEVDASGAPISGNHITGGATVIEASGKVVDYSAVGLRGFENNNGDDQLCLGTEDPDESCPNGAEYEGCASRWTFLHPPEMEGRTVNQLTILPCSLDLATQHGTTAQIHFRITNEFEETFSASTTVIDHARLSLREINNVFTSSRIGGEVVHTELLPTSGSPGIFAVGEIDGAAVDLVRDGSTPALLMMGGR